MVSTAATSQTQAVQISEPGIYTLDNLFKKADVVVLIRILSGDTENYSSAVYKGEVIQSFKASKKGAILYFGPYEGLRLGSESLLFLRGNDQTIEPKNVASPNYGKVRYYTIFDEGYSSMEASYQCVFDGKVPSQSCDYGVRVCTDYIKLPVSTPAFPPEDNDPPFGCRWVRQKVFFKLLEELEK